MGPKLARRIPVFVAVALVSASPASAQLIAVRTVPLATGDQFLVHPSATLGMGGVTVAVDDRLRDPFVDPARGSRLESHRFVSSPTVYTITNDGGAGRTLPVAFLGSGARWFGALSVALQEVEASGGPTFPSFRFVGSGTGSFRPGGRLLREESGTNTYVAGVIGRRLADGISVGAGASWAGLDAVGGVEHLYAGALGVRADGDVADFRLGLLADRPSGRTLEAVLVHQRVDVRHDVTYPGGVAPEPTDPLPDGLRTETSDDRSRTWGLHFGWVEPVGTRGWSVGFEVTGNRKDHPSIPDYEIARIPRDPGETWAYALAGGIGRVTDGLRYGADVVLAPAWSETWALAEERVIAADGSVLHPGERTVENDFFFTNLALRMGLERTVGAGSFQLGLEVRSTSYTLEQLDRVALREREEEESWLEWTPTVGGHVDLSELRIGYQGLLTTGTGRPGVAWSDDAVTEATRFAADSGIDFLPAPAGPLTLQDATVWTHRLTVSIPVR